MVSEEEIKKLREQLNEKYRNLEKENAKEQATAQPLRERMKRNRKTWEMVYKIQKDTFFNYSVKKWGKKVGNCYIPGIPKEEQEDLFAEYFTEFEREKINSISQFLLSRGFTFHEDNQGKLLIE